MRPTACRAPSMNLYFFANGDVGACCRNRSYGNIATSRLADIWAGARRRDLGDRLARDDYSMGCDLCAVEHRIEGRAASFTAQFDHWADVFAVPDDPPWPVRMEFELANTCNLQCVQCSGDLSSTIRSRREHREPMPHRYGDEFVDDLRPFLPHLELASFVGGEPFLIPEYYRIWDLIAEVAPDLPCVVVTNGTQWNDRVEQVLERVNVQPYVSIDGATAPTYESIRVGADFDVVMQHLDRFHAHARRRGHRASIVFCVMPSNVGELPDLLLYAEERGILLTTSIVREPAEHSLAHLDATALADACRRLERRDAEMTLRLELNAAVWRTELERVRALAAAAETPVRGSWMAESPRIMMFLRQGDGPTDESRELDLLATGGASSDIHRFRVGADDLASGVTPELAALLGLDVDELDGRPIAAIQKAFRRRAVVEQSPDRYELAVQLDAGPARLVMVPRRDDRGWADDVAVFVALAAPAVAP